MRSKLESYAGLAQRAGKVIFGYNTCLLYIKRKKVDLLLLGSDLSENTLKKMKSQADKQNVQYKIFLKSDELSQIFNKTGKGVFGITDKQFAKIILQEIENGMFEIEGGASYDSKS